MVLKKVKRGIVGLLAASLMISAAACGGGSKDTEETTAAAEETTAAEETEADAGQEETAAPAADSGETVTISIAARGGSHVDAIESVKADFEAAHNCKIEVSGYEAADLKKNIMLDSTKPTGNFDLVMADDPWMPEFTEAQIFLNLTEAGYEADSDLVQQCLDIGKVPYGEGDQYALPFSGNVMFLFYNKDLVSDVPTDWNAVLAAAEQVQADGNLGYVIRGQQGNPIVSDWLPIYWAMGGEVFDENWEAQVNSEKGIAALELYIKLLETGANYEKNDLVAAVSDGKAAMSLGWPSWYVSGSEASAAYAVIPGKVDADSETYPAGMIGNWMMGVTGNSGNQELAIELLNYLTSAESQKIMADAGGVPTRESVLTDAELVEKYPHFPTLLEATKASKVRPRHTNWSKAEEVLGAELSAAVSGVKTPEEALAAAAEAMNDVIK
ncbi:MAG: extracellular solute-binding protein [Fastidiosipilaceae bacterium]|jgi:multiple sugar transport system substrate-binding protein|nr:extracellular solute-binding protein [Clostridiaceae bacterium]